jgi:hypothetical protein
MRWRFWRRCDSDVQRDPEAVRAREGAEWRLERTKAEGPAIERAKDRLEATVSADAWVIKFKRALGAE